MKSLLIPVVTLLSCALAGSVSAQAPIAGSGQLPVLDPSAESPRIVVDAVAKVMSNRRDKRPFLAIKECFRQSRLQTALRSGCRLRLDTYHGDMIRKYSSEFANIEPIVSYTRLVEISDDPDAMRFRRDLVSLRGIVRTVEQAGVFREVKDCYVSAGPQPAMQQLCRRQLDAFVGNVLRNRGANLRDVKPELIRRRILAVATSNQVGIAAGDQSTFDSLRNIRKSQQERRAAAKTALLKARPYYCQPGKQGRRSGSLSQSLASGVCLCSYGRRFVGSNPAVPRRQARVAYKQCGPTGRFRVTDINGGRLNHGDWITLQATHGGYLSLNRDGLVYGNRQHAGKAEKFRVIRATNLPGPIRPGEMITLVSALRAFVVPDLRRGALRATKEKPQPHEFFVLIP